MHDNNVHRVAITGVGCISALGHNAVQFWDALSNGVCGIGPLTKVVDQRLNARIAAEIKDFVAVDHFERRQLNLLDPFAQYALIAAEEAVECSGLDFEGCAGAQTAIVLPRKEEANASQSGILGRIGVRNAGLGAGATFGSCPGCDADARRCRAATE